MSNMEASPTPTSSTDDTPQVVGDGAATLPLRPPTSGKIKPTRKALEVWKHFIKEPFELGSNIGPRASWKYCRASYACDPIKNGTSTMMQHLRDKCTRGEGGCPLREENKQKVLVFDNKGTVVAHSNSTERSRIACVKMIILDELPFRHVEGVGFRLFMRECQPRFDPPSRRTIARDVWDLFQEEKVKIKSVLNLNSKRVSLTTDTWTSLQNVNYMALTAHFIDDSWKLHKKIINFYQITNHRGEAIGRLVEDCLHDWGIDKVFTITLDNATANDGAIRHMKRQLKLWGTLLLDGDCLHMRCCAHILNLIVFDGLSELHDSIKSIREACVYTRSSPSRFNKFRHCLALQKIDSEGLLPLKCKTRWNSLYLMLEAALKLQKEFDRLEEEAADYASYFHQSGGDHDDGIPKKKKRKVQEGEICTKKKLKPSTVADWEYARAFVKFLKIF
ncbi:PREDICTED: zinc finger BED domain-containing protein RICESLEEPER 2-like [Prunus mume]|uniref:Zinc finger BED domain-containing protein RICESLEEPER 2-like n=1 Tax=Prunus mume TaxID=102107 RepID=A0ABM1LSX1_PRUMU|nr:PREDICTED: zinc finger BED domain-containing protein RICESLEEPER 2-like [Prunus mume]